MATPPDYATIKENVMKLPSGEIEDRIKQLTEQLIVASADFDHRMDAFNEHIDHIRNVIAYIKTARIEMQKDFDKCDLKKLEASKEGLRRVLHVLEDNVKQLSNQIKIERNDKDIIIKTERKISEELEDISHLTSSWQYRVNRRDVANLNTLARSRLSESLGAANNEEAEIKPDPMKLAVFLHRCNDTHLNLIIDIVGAGSAAKSLPKEEKVAAIMAKGEPAVQSAISRCTRQFVTVEATTLAVVRELITLTDRLEENLKNLETFLAEERRIISEIEKDIPSKKSVDFEKMRNNEMALSRILQRIYATLVDENQRVHEPLRFMIDRQRTGIEEVLEWKRVFDETGKQATFKDVQKAMNKLTDRRRADNFFSALASHPDMLDEKAGERVERLASMYDSAYSALEQQATKDPLTKLFNRRYFESKFIKILEGHSQFCLFMIDIDHFKGFNDTYGHDVGDLVLQNVAQVLLTRIRPGDLPCRWGGEEMMVLLHDADLKKALEICDERFRQGIPKIDLLDEKGNKVTHVVKNKGKPNEQKLEIRKIYISGGLVHVTGEDFPPDKTLKETEELIIKKADGLLYKAKKAGRNAIWAQEFGSPENEGVIKRGTQQSFWQRLFGRLLPKKH